MASETYLIFREAILREQQVTCIYKGAYREVCPVIIGHSNGQEKVLTYQFGGGSKSGLPPGGEWRCMFPCEVSDARLRDGPWHEAAGHSSAQTCVEEVDLDVNIQVRHPR